jgi:hypothetical protein
MFCGIILTAFVFAVSVDASSGSAAQCNLDSLRRCDAYSRLNVDIRNSKTTYDTEQKLDTVCSQLDALVRCRDEFASGCSSSGGNQETDKLERYIDTFTYVCRDVKAVYLSKVSCFTGEQTRSNLSHCADNMNVQNTTCGAFTDWVDCNRRAYAYHCGKEPADVITSVLKKMHKNPCSGAGCLHQLNSVISYAMMAAFVVFNSVFNNWL